MKRILGFIALISLLATGCISQSKNNIVVVSGEYYEMDFHLPARWENRLDEWDEYLLPPKGECFLRVYIVMKSVSDMPIELRHDDYKLSYTLGGTERYTTTLVATGNNDVYMWAIDRDYGGVTDPNGYGRRYVFSVPKNASDFVLTVTSLPPIPLSVR